MRLFKTSVFENGSDSKTRRFWVNFNLAGNLFYVKPMCRQSFKRFLRLRLLQNFSFARATAIEKKIGKS
jgi:hypothetical protein